MHTFYIYFALDGYEDRLIQNKETTNDINAYSISILSFEGPKKASFILMLSMSPR